MKKGRIMALFIVIALVLGLALPAVAAGPPDSPGEGNSVLTKITFIHYPKGVEVKGGIPGKPDGGDAKVDKEWFRYRDVCWLDTSVTYKIDDLDDDTFEDAIKAAFQTWDDEAAISFTCIEIGALDYGIPSSFYEDETNPYGTSNGVNEVGWMSFSAGL